MILKTFLLLSLLTLFTLSNNTPTFSSFKDIGKHHCSTFPIELLLRIATGNLSEKYGQSYYDYDCYIKQFVREDGNLLEEDEDEEDSEEDEEQMQIEQEKIPDIDPIVLQYAQGLKECLPEGSDPVKSVYSIWRFYRFIVQHDYAFEWMRAKIRSGLGYEAEKPNAWMDGEMNAPRLRLQKLFSNQFYEYLDTLMFRDFLYPIMTFLEQNTVIALNGQLTESGKPILLQSLETHNYMSEIFKPVILRKEGDKDIFSYTIPGVPLLFAGSNQRVAWSFTGVLVDRSNVEEIETVGNKFYNHDTEEWISLKSEELQIAGVKDKTCKFMHCAYGTLYTKHDRKGKVSEYISKWHEDERKNRVLFSQLYELIKNDGNMKAKRMQFPFNSLMLVNDTGIFQYLCPQNYPSYFLYPDMFGEPEPIEERWITTKKKYIAVSNGLLTTMKQQSYKKGQTLSPAEEQIAIAIRAHPEKFTLQNSVQFIKGIATNPHIKKQKQLMLAIYRRVKFIYLPDEQIRKQCDQLINLLQKWDNNLDNEAYSPIYILWEYFMKDYTFNYISVSKYGAAIIKHKILSDVYWTGQMGLWSKGTSYGECDSHEYENEIKKQVNGTGHNSTCYFNIIRGINRTRQIIFNKYEKVSEISLNDFKERKVLDINEDFMGSEIEQAFKNYYSRNLLYGAEVGNKKIIYHSSHLETQQETTLDSGKGEDEKESEKEKQQLNDL